MSLESHPNQPPLLEKQRIPPSTMEEMDEAIAALQSNKDGWINVSLRDRVEILDELICGYGDVMVEWVQRSLECRRDIADPYAIGEEWVSGPAAVLRLLRGLRRALLDIGEKGAPSVPGPVWEGSSGQVAVRIFPQSLYERLVTPGVTAEVRMEPEVTLQDLSMTQAVAYEEKDRGGKVVLVLGGGNVAGIPPNDTLSKLFVENRVVLLKMHPVNEYLGPLIERSFRKLIEFGYLRVVYGGVSEGEYLCHHPGVDELHITGSDKTYEVIVFGTGEEGERRKSEKRPLIRKRFTSELGNVAPVIVVPGPWTAGDLEYQAEQLVSHISDHAGFSCSRGRVILQHSDWHLRDELLQRMRFRLAQVPTQTAYYPGAHELYQRFLDAHPAAERYGNPGEEQIPWTLIPDLDPADEEDICFKTESFCPLIAESGLEASGVPEYLDRAVAFANETLWGTLSAAIIVHPHSLKDPKVAEAVERALDNLKYGIVAVNGLPGMAWVMTSPPWGSYPGNEIDDIQSGTGFVHNTFMFSRPQKTVVRAPFKIWPKPIWFNSRTRAFKNVARKVAMYDLAPSWMKLPGILIAGLK